jgi:acyl-CoA hydrolase
LCPKQLQIRIGGQRPFVDGLYGCSEMLVEGLLELRRHGIVKRRAETAANAVPQKKGPFIHSAFFLGSEQLYEELRTLEADAIDDIEMSPVSFVNHLYGDEDRKRRDRQHARFINRAMMVTALGAVVSDGLESGQVVSGVGGQYNFVAQAHELSGARSIIMLDAVRTRNGKASSNIVWNYGHTTIPRHLRDIIVTEYGVADLRGKSDQDVIAEMLSITDARFQDDLLAAAKRAGKMPKDFNIPDTKRSNTPAQVCDALRTARSEGILPAFPLGTEMTPTEQALLTALRHLKTIRHSQPKLLSAVMAGGLGPAPSQNEQEALDRLRLGSPSRVKEKVLRWCVLAALRHCQRQA